VTRYSETRTGRRFALAEKLAESDDCMDLCAAQIGVVILEFCENAGVSHASLVKVARKIPHGMELLRVV
jgi:hypothetical protein